MRSKRQTQATAMQQLDKRHQQKAQDKVDGSNAENADLASPRVSLRLTPGLGSATRMSSEGGLQSSNVDSSGVFGATTKKRKSRKKVQIQGLQDTDEEAYAAGDGTIGSELDDDGEGGRGKHLKVGKQRIKVRQSMPQVNTLKSRGMVESPEPEEDSKEVDSRIPKLKKRKSKK